MTITNVLRRDEWIKPMFPEPGMNERNESKRLGRPATDAAPNVDLIQFYLESGLKTDLPEG
jgi:hypothetical protein